MMDKSMIFESGVDLISALPDELLCHILSFLPTKIAVCTSVLSTRWRFLYNLPSNIDIDIDLTGSSCLEKSNRFMTFVERDLLSWDRPPIQRFRLKWRHHHIDPLQVYGWISALMCRNIQELELYDRDRTRGFHVVELHANIFSCETLVSLKLFVVDNLKIPPMASLPNLKVLHIMGYSIVGDHMDNMLSSCPVLEDLVLNKFFLITNDDTFNLNIFNATLKRLTICFSPPPSCRATQIVVNSPALVHLNYTLYAKQSLVLLAKQSLAEVVISGHSSQPVAPVTYANAEYANAHKHDVLKEINNIQSLQIVDFTLQGIRDHNLLLPIFNRLTHLKICDSAFAYSACLYDSGYLEYLLVQCVVLETLVLEIKWTEHRRNRIESLFKRTRLSGLLRHLKIFKIQLVNVGVAEAFLKIIEFFLGNAEVLEELTVLLRDFSQSETMRELLTALPRVSKKMSGGCR